MPPKPSAPTVEYVHHVARGEHQLGVRIGGVFVPFASLSDARVAQLVEHAVGAAAAAAEEDEGGDE